MHVVGYMLGLISAMISSYIQNQQRCSALLSGLVLSSGTVFSNREYGCAKLGGSVLYYTIPSVGGSPSPPIV